MEAWQIDSALYRPLKSGKEYEGLIPKPSGVNKIFEPRGVYSNTHDTLRFMDMWADKYAYQMEKIAPLMKGRDLAETADNIYKFLYHHFQYRLDQDEQTLLAPGHAWANRKTGFDCKSFSILASTILRNLGIKHYFRKVMQFGVAPGQWSHVYVIVPDGTKIRVIDGTKHENKEGRFVEKFDYMTKLRHRGLASPDFTGLGCECQGRSIPRSALAGPEMTMAKHNFERFLASLLAEGAHPATVAEIRNIVNYNLGRGVDPNFAQAMSLAAARTGGRLGKSVDAAGFIKSVVPDSFLNGIVHKIGGVFSDIFANGFDPSCINASLAPSEGKERVTKIYQPYFQALLGQIQAAQTGADLSAPVNKFIHEAYVAYVWNEFLLPKAAGWSNCSKKTINNILRPYMRSVKQAADDLVAQLEGHGAVKTMYLIDKFRQEIPQSNGKIAVFNKSGDKPGQYEISAPAVDCSKIDMSQVNLGPGQSPSGITIPHEDGSYTVVKPDGSSIKYGPDGAKQGETPKPKPGKTGTMWLVGGAGVAAALMFAFPTKKPAKLGAPKTRKTKATKSRRRS